MATISPYPHTVFPLCIHACCLSLYVQISSSHEDASFAGLGPALMVSFLTLSALLCVCVCVCVCVYNKVLLKHKGDRESFFFLFP